MAREEKKVMSLREFSYITLAKQLGLPPLPEVGKPWSREQFWGIIDVDTENGLYLLHYDPEMVATILTNPKFSAAEKEALLDLRGKVVNAEGRVVCSSYGYTPL